MTRTKHLFQGLILSVVFAASSMSQTSGESRLDDQSGLRIYSPSANWAFHQPDEPDVRILLGADQDQAKISFRVLDNLEVLDDTTYITKFKERQAKLKFDNSYSSDLINGRRWYDLAGKSKSGWFEMQMSFDRENVFLLHYEAPSKEVFQKHAADRRVLLTRLEYNSIATRRLSQFESLEIEVVPAQNARIKEKRDLDEVPELLRKELTKATLFKEVHVGRTDSAAKTVLLTVRVITFYRDPQTYIPASLQPGLSATDEYRIGPNIIEAELVLTDQETGKVIYTHQMKKRQISTVYGGYAVKHIITVLKAKK